MAKRTPTSREMLIEAGQLLHGDVEWMSKFAATIGVSKQLVAAMVAGDRPVSAKTTTKVLQALEEEVERLQKARARLDEIRATMARRAVEK